MIRSRVFVVPALLLLVDVTAAQCPTVDFDTLAVGTRISTQYYGVTFSARFNDGSVGPIPVIYNPNGSTTSEPQCLSAFGDGINEFSDEYLRLVFDRDQTEVTFNLGVRVGCTADDTVLVRLYDSGGVLRRTMTIPVNGELATERVLVFVRAMRTDGGAFRRLEIDAGFAGGCAARFELIDDLTFDIDDTPPIAEITTPGPLACVCNGSTIFGSAYDPDGPIDRWRLERKAPDAAGWTLIASSTSEIVNGALSTWTTVAAQGYYILRLTVTNACGIDTVATTVVWLDRNFDSLSIRSPVSGQVLGGTVCVDGTAWDHCGGTVVVERRPLGGAWTPFDTISPPWVITDPLGSWNTRGVVVDGDYEVRVRSSDDCSNTGQATVTVTIDNTPPIAVITDPVSCSFVSGRVTIRGTVNDAHLASWSLQYTGGDAHGWVTLKTDSRPVVNGILGTWDVSELPPCAYALRLLATDSAVLDCNGALRNQSEYMVTFGIESCTGDIDGDGDVDLQDLALLLSAFGTHCP
ncbi:MAG: hypothetical protein AMXMBFR47_09330 [Planctomycetota bacterium]